MGTNSMISVSALLDKYDIRALSISALISVKRVIHGYPRMHIFLPSLHTTLPEFTRNVTIRFNRRPPHRHLTASLSDYHRISNQVKMVSSVEKKGPAAAGADAGAPEKPVLLDLPDPSGWTKEFFPENSGETLRRSSRIIAKKAKAPLVEPKSDPPKKRCKKSASKKKASEDKEQETKDVVDVNEDEKDKKQYGRRGKAN